MKEKKLEKINQFRIISLLNEERSTSKVDFRVLGGHHINGYIFTESRHTRVPQMRETHECY